MIIGAPGSGGDELANLLELDSVVAAWVNSDVVGLLDRDWTCPPVAISASSVPTDVIAAEVDRLDAERLPWGAFDPLLLFTLPLWLEHVPAVRLVAAIRPHEEIVRTLQAEHHLPPATADDLARAYSSRVDRLRRSFDVPVIDMSSSREDVLAQVERLLFDGAENQTATTEPISATALREAFAEFAADADLFDRYSGPRASRRRSMVWSCVPPELETIVELTRSPIRGAAEPASKRGRSLPCNNLDGLYGTARRLTSGVDAVLLPDAPSWLGPQDLAPALAVLRAHLNIDGMVVVGLSHADAETRRMLGRDVISEHDIVDSAAAASFTVLSTRRDSHLIAVRLVALADMAALRSAEEWQARYERLRRRRSVRLALAGSASTRPIFRLVRKLRRGGGERRAGSSRAGG